MLKMQWLILNYKKNADLIYTITLSIYIYMYIYNIFIIYYKYFYKHECETIDKRILKV